MASNSAFATEDGSVLIGYLGDNGNFGGRVVKNMDVVDVTDKPECIGCFKELEGDGVVVVSDCGHFMCLECSNEWEDSTCETDMQFNCPLCREVIETRTICIARTFARGTGIAEDPIIIL